MLDCLGLSSKSLDVQDTSAKVIYTSQQSFTKTELDRIHHLYLLVQYCYTNTSHVSHDLHVSHYL